MGGMIPKMTNGLKANLIRYERNLSSKTEACRQKLAGWISRAVSVLQSVLPFLGRGAKKETPATSISERSMLSISVKPALKANTDAADGGRVEALERKENKAGGSNDNGDDCLPFGPLGDERNPIKNAPHYCRNTTGLLVAMGKTRAGDAGRTLHPLEDRVVFNLLKNLVRDIDQTYAEDAGLTQGTVRSLLDHIEEEYGSRQPKLSSGDEIQRFSAYQRQLRKIIHRLPK